MSDPVTNVEIEDVLSSIRRLVSDEERVAVRKPGKPPADLLILTPEQRVPGTSNKGASSPAPGAQKRAGQKTDPVAKASASAGIKADPPIGQASAALLLDRSAKRPHRNDPASADASDSNDTPARGGDLYTLHANRAGADKPADAPADGSLESKIAELEAMFAKGAPRWETEEDEDGSTAPFAPPSPRPQNASEASQASADGAPATKPAGTDLVDPSAQPLLDEAALREMVSEIVRQELQGVLGERITRNVRKLVRREINRALLSQDFD